jgi:hypothetical protein
MAEAAAAGYRAAVTIADAPPSPTPVVLERISG